MFVICFIAKVLEMKRTLFLLQMIFCNHLVYCQSVTRDPLPLYELLVEKLPIFLNENIVKWKNLCESDSENKYVEYGILSIDSVKANTIFLSFSYYHEKTIFKESLKNAYGIVWGCGGYSLGLINTIGRYQQISIIISLFVRMNLTFLDVVYGE